jgi:hypothetical protein
MSPLNKINIAAQNWERTRDPKYKKEWYKLIKDYSKRLDVGTRHPASSHVKKNTNPL